MNQLMQVANGLLFGIGLIIASALMKAVLKIGFCG